MDGGQAVTDHSSCGKCHSGNRAGTPSSSHAPSSRRSWAALKEDLEMTDNSFPYVLICSTFGTIVSLASVWIATAHSFAPVLVA